MHNSPICRQGAGIPSIPPAYSIQFIRQAALTREWNKITGNELLPKHLSNAPVVCRLKSRNPIWKEQFFVAGEDYVYDVNDEWIGAWN